VGKETIITASPLRRERPAGIVANQTKQLGGGSSTTTAAERRARFVKLCNAFAIRSCS